MAQLLLKEAGLISTSVQAMLYGFSALMFILTMWILLRNRHRRRLCYGMLYAASALFILATSEMVVNIVRICQGFLNIGPKLPGGPEQYFNDIAQPTFVAKSCLYNAQTLILDGVVIYRTYIVWQSVLVVVLPMIMWCGLLSASIGTNIALATASKDSGNVFAAETGRWITATYSSTLATNLSASTLLAFRIWQINCEASQYRSDNRLNHVLRAVIESGAIYSLTITAALITFLVKSPSVYVILDLISPIISIVFYMIIIRVRIAADTDRGMPSVTTGQLIGLGAPDSPTSQERNFGPSNLRRPHFEMKSVNVEITQYTVTDADNSSLEPEHVI